jgi:hypothetical protein
LIFLGTAAEGGLFPNVAGEFAPRFPISPPQPFSLVLMNHRAQVDVKAGVGPPEHTLCHIFAQELPFYKSPEHRLPEKFRDVDRREEGIRDEGAVREKGSIARKAVKVSIVIGADAWAR